jgi:hypothetical protein
MKYALAIIHNNQIVGYFDKRDNTCYTTTIHLYDTEADIDKVFDDVATFVTYKYGANHLVVRLTISQGVISPARDFERHMDVVKSNWGEAYPERVTTIEQAIEEIKIQLDLIIRGFSTLWWSWIPALGILLYYSKKYGE